MGKFWRGGDGGGGGGGGGENEGGGFTRGSLKRDVVM